MKADLLLRTSVATILLGRGYQQIFWDVPYRTVLWDEEFMAPVVKYFGGSWNFFVQSGVVDDYTNYVTRLVGIVLFLVGVFVAINIKNKVMPTLLRISSGLLFLTVFCQYEESHFQFPMLIEHAVQVGLPLWWSFYATTETRSNKAIWILRQLVGLTFLGHGLYAFGIPYPVPGEFLDMTMIGMRLQEQDAFAVLKMAGFVDSVIAVTLLLPGKFKPLLTWAFIWGMATACARVYCFTWPGTFWSDLHAWGFETVYRLCHGLVPLALVILPEVSFKWKWQSKIETEGNVVRS